MPPVLDSRGTIVIPQTISGQDGVLELIWSLVIARCRVEVITLGTKQYVDHGRPLEGIRPFIHMESWTKPSERGLCGFGD